MMDRQTYEALRQQRQWDIQFANYHRVNDQLERVKEPAPLNPTYRNQIVSLPDKSEESRYVFDVAPASDARLPSDATLTGFVCNGAERLPVFYSSSWRTWFPIDSAKVSR